MNIDFTKGNERAWFDHFRQKIKRILFSKIEIEILEFGDPPSLNVPKVRSQCFNLKRYYRINCEINFQKIN